MATRFYLPISGTPPLASLTVNSNWELTNNLTRLPCFPIKQNTGLTQVSAVWAAALTQQWCWKQWQSEPMVSGYSWTTSDTISMVIKVAESTAQVDSHLAYVVRVVSEDGSIIRGIIGLYHTTSTEYPTSLATIATRIHSARTNGATNFTSQIGDRIIIEIGHHGVTPALAIVYHNYGDPSATEDYALTADLVTDLCPWVELSRTVSFGAAIIEETASAVKYKGITSVGQVNLEDPVSVAKYKGITLVNQVNLQDLVSIAKYKGISAVSQTNEQDGTNQTKFIGVDPINNLTVEETLYGG